MKAGSGRACKARGDSPRPHRGRQEPEGALHRMFAREHATLNTLILNAPRPPRPKTLQQANLEAWQKRTGQRHG